MDKEFKPTRESLHIRLLWLAWPAVLVFCLDFFSVIDEIDSLTMIILIVGIAVCARQAILNHGRKLSFYLNQIIITDYFGRTRTFDYKLIEHPGIEDNRKRLLPRRQIFVFSYHEAGNVQYRLSDLSENDRLEVIKILVKIFPEIGEDLQ